MKNIILTDCRGRRLVVSKKFKSLSVMFDYANKKTLKQFKNKENKKQISTILSYINMCFL